MLIFKYILWLHIYYSPTYLGTIGLDDVTIFPGDCTLKPERALIDPRDCSFEFDFCGWRSINPGNIEGTVEGQKRQYLRINTTDPN